MITLRLYEDQGRRARCEGDDPREPDAFGWDYQSGDTIAVGDGLYRLVQVGSQIHTEAPSGSHYVFAEAEPA